jgi:DNA-binding NtrC family response regulator
VTKEKLILIVDDDPRVLLILATALERMEPSHQIVTSRDGNDALAKIGNGRFDLLISDVRIPGLDGVALVEAMRALDLRTAVIWITAYGCARLRAECDRLQVYCCLDKPLRIDEIRRTVLAALETSFVPDGPAGHLDEVQPDG